MASLPPDPWKALGVEKSADKSEIRAAYKKLVLKCHPDKVQDPALKAQKQDEFQKVQQAYELLNDDAERVKYEEQVKVMELRKQAAMIAKNMPNSSASRSSPRHAEIRTAEPRQKMSTPSSGAKIYAYASAHSRSEEEMSFRYPFEDGEKHARRTASYEKAFRDEDRRDKDDRRRRRDDDEFKARLREKEKEVKEREEREARKAERKKSEKERDKERRRGVEERHRRHASPYIEDNESEDQHPYPSKDKKRSPSNKPYEGRDRERERQREKSTTSRRPPSPHTAHIEIPQPVPPAPAAPTEPEYYHNLDKAATYIEKSKRQSTNSFSSSRGPDFSFSAPPVAPTPPPADADDDLRATTRAAGRRASQEASKSREKLPSSKMPYIIDSASPKSSRIIPQLPKSHTVPLSMEPSSPPRVGINRSSTTQEYSTSAPKIPPTFGRTQTWGPGSHDRHNEYFVDVEDSEDDHHYHRRRRGSRRSTRSPEPHPHPPAVYKVEGTKTTRMDPQYAYGESPNSRRYGNPDVYSPHGMSSQYPEYIKVKESKKYGPADVRYTEASYNVSYSRDPFSQVYA